MKKVLLKEYLYQVLVATGLWLVALPYVLLTNTTATTIAILVHSLLMWFFLPVLITLVETIRSNKSGLSLPLHIIATLTALTTASSLTVIIFHILSHEPYRILLSPALWAALLPIYSAYLLILFFRLWRENQVHKVQLQASRDHAAFVALSSQLKPHFLFNTLNTIEYLIGQSPDKAKTCVQKLAGLYRGILRHSELTTLPFNEELNLCKFYIELQKERFDERLTIHWNLPNDLSQYHIPPSILLNALENSCKYGVEGLIEAKPIYITVKDISEKKYQISVKNTIGDIGTQGSENFGHKDLKERLKLIYKDQAKVNIIQDISCYELQIQLLKEPQQ